MSYIIREMKHNQMPNRVWVEVVALFDDGPFKVAVEPEVVEGMGAWCDEHRMGTRMSYDQFVFKNQEELTLFLLRWTV